jgi:1,4-dihydroxy-2-naphthoyl-CoA hydrolase
MTKFSYQRIIRFADTDAAGVVYFANLLSICHEAYEEYLSSLKINLNSFFQDNLIAIPIIHAEIDFLKPLFCGDIITINMELSLVNEQVFVINYRIFQENLRVATAITKHIAINPQTRKTKLIPAVISQNLT